MRGRFLVIEGIDGSGKGTQVELLVRRLKALKVPVETIGFPEYGKPSAYFIEQYLRGSYGDIHFLGSRLPSVFFALDRFEASFKIRDWLKRGKVVIADRYLASNLGHQGGKIKNTTERRAFIKWLYNFEYGILKIPKPDMSIILDLTAKIAYKLIGKKSRRHYLRGRKRDAHEMSEKYLHDSRRAYLEVARIFPKEFKIINCMRAGRLMTIAEIHEIIFKAMRRIIKI